MQRFLKFIALAGCLLFAGTGLRAQKVVPLQGEWHASDSAAICGSIILPGTVDEARLAPENPRHDVSTGLTRRNPFIGKMTYSRSVDIPQIYKNQHLTLFVERTKPCTVSIDGKVVGSASNIQQAVEIELGGVAPGRHDISITVDNRDETVPEEVRGSHAWAESTQTNWNGMVGRIEIRIQPACHISGMRVIPHVDGRTAEVKVSLAGRKTKGTLTVGGLKRRLNGEKELTVLVPFGQDAQLWSEQNPVTYSVTANLHTRFGDDSRTLRFGFREFSTVGTNLAVNGKAIFLRGTHDGCVFPLTGYPPMTPEPWLQYFGKLKEYGFNHIRCHSWTPPEAAFEAADSLGIYIQAELPAWGTLSEDKPETLDFLMEDGLLTLTQVGNHPSFMSLAFGNEMWGDKDLFRKIGDRFRAADDTHLYLYGSNNNLGFNGYEGGDYYVTCRTGYDTDTTYSTHTRSSFSYADAWKGGIMNNRRPASDWDYSGAISGVPVPVVSHESAQFEMYPEYGNLDKYTGVLRPDNFGVFRSRLDENGLTGQAEAFAKATQQFALRLYKADIEACLRTPGFGGYQILDIKDYPGQGSALVGILDAFMDEKMDNSREVFGMFNREVAPLARLPHFCWENDEVLDGSIVIANYSQGAVESTLSVDFAVSGRSIYRSDVAVVAPVGVSSQAELQIPLSGVNMAAKALLTVEFAGVRNVYELWIYPTGGAVLPSEFIETDIHKAIARAQAGERVLLTPTGIEAQSVGPFFTTDYWNYAMFKTISENNGKEVCPGTMGMLMDASHPLFRKFPTDGFSNWQWWPVAHHSRPLILDRLPADYLPLIQTIDNIERNHKLGILMEFKVGEGSILLCTTALEPLLVWPEGRQYVKALGAYLRSEDFNPSFSISPEGLIGLLSSTVEERDIQGVKNITSYK